MSVIDERVDLLRNVLVGAEQAGLDLHRVTVTLDYQGATIQGGDDLTSEQALAILGAVSDADVVITDLSALGGRPFSRYAVPNARVLVVHPSDEEE